MAVLNPSPVEAPKQALTPPASVSDRDRLTKLAQSYQADQQLKFLHLQAEVEVLLQQLQALKQRRQDP